MKAAQKLVLLSLVLFSALMLARAEDKFGVKVYDGAKFDADTSAFMARMASQSACYRTTDPLSKVIAFYGKLPGVATIHSNDKGAMFKLNGVTITLQNPWLNMKTGAHNTDTLISIVKN